MTDVFPNAVDCFSSGGLRVVHRSNDVCPHPARVVVHALFEQRVEDADQLAANHYDRLFSFQWILLPGRIIPIHIAELGVAPNQRKNRLKEDLPQLLPPALTDGGLTLVLAGAVSFNSSPASFWICFGESKRPISPTSERNPATVMSPIPLMARSFST